MAPTRALPKFSLLALTFLLLGSIAVASTTPSQTRSADAAHRVVFGADANYAPFDYIDKSGQPAGFDVELFKSVARHAGLQVKYRLGTWKTILAELDAGTIDVVPMLVTPERKRVLRFTEPFLYQYHLAFGPRGG